MAYGNRGLQILVEPVEAPTAKDSRRLISVDGASCTTKEQLIKSFAAALQFPAYSRTNWDSFDECMSDLEWLSDAATGVLLRVNEADSLMASSLDELPMAISILDRSSAEAHVPLGIELICRTSDGAQRLEIARREAGGRP